jgi:hypothetical protein
VSTHLSVFVCLSLVVDKVLVSLFVFVRVCSCETGLQRGGDIAALLGDVITDEEKTPENLRTLQGQDFAANYGQPSQPSQRADQSCAIVSHQVAVPVGRHQRRQQRWRISLHVATVSCARCFPEVFTVVVSSSVFRAAFVPDLKRRKKFLRVCEEHDVVVECEIGVLDVEIIYLAASETDNQLTVHILT